MWFYLAFVALPVNCFPLLACCCLSPLRADHEGFLVTPNVVAIDSRAYSYASPHKFYTNSLARFRLFRSNHFPK